MFIQQFYDEGLAHLSYMIGDENQAFVIDPHLDIDDYLDFAQKKKISITHIFETHRNEDYVIGSRNLAQVTHAKIYHGSHLHFAYGHNVKEGDEFATGTFALKILETPGHTPESISLVLYDKLSSPSPFAVFTGDALFAGTVGRTDLWKTREVAAGILYDSIYQKILPLGDHVLLYPAHGAGSVCGEGLSSRTFSTIGYEKKYNEELQDKTKQEFINKQTKKHFDIPPYFKEMEKRNQNAPDILHNLPQPIAITIEALQDKTLQIVDVRSAEAYASVAVPNSIAIPAQLLSKFAGWFLDYEREIILIADSDAMLESAIRQLIRLGYNKFKGWLSGVHAWEISGKPYWHIPTVQATEIKNRLEQHKEFILLDVRSETEWKAGHLPGAQHIFIGELPHRIKEITDSQVISTFCGSGQRALIAASLLKQHGFNQVEVCFGSMAACKKIGCPIVKD